MSLQRLGKAVKQKRDPKAQLVCTPPVVPSISVQSQCSS